MRFDLTDLSLFRHVVEAGSITHGAERAHLALAAASTRIRNMEQTLGAPLQVRVLSNTNALTEFLPEALSAFLASHPNVSVDLEERLSDEIVGLIAEGVGDIGIVAGTVDARRLTTYPFRSDRFVLVVAREHALARRAKIGFAEVLDHDFVGLDRASALQRFLAS